MAKIIQLTRKNIRQLAEIDSQSGHPTERNRGFESYKKELIERFNKKHEIFFGYKENGELKGYATLKPFFSGHKHCEIYWIAVKKGYQKQGIGTKLIKFTELYAKKAGFRKVFLYTNKKMKSARAFYEKSGYKFINEFPDYYGYSKNNTAVLYSKKL